MYRIPIALFCASAAFAGSIQYHWSIAQSEVNISEYNQWDVISVQDGMAVFGNGYPNLPGVPRCYVIPQGTTVTGVEVSNITTLSLGSLFLPSPVMILPLIEDVPEVIDYTEPHFEGLPASFPESQISGFKTGTKTGFRLGSYSFVPFRYSRDSGELFLITSAEINMIYEHDPEAPVYHLTEGQVDLAKRGLATFVDNPEMLNIWSPSTRTETDADIEVIIVGYDEHSSQLSDLVSLHNTLGYASESVTVQWIQDNMEGYDLPEKIRNHIRDLYENNGLQFVVMVTDAGETTRYSSLQIPYFPTHNESKAYFITDLYFSDLDGTWDASGNHLYGEEFDIVDYYSDVYVGRYPTAETETSQLQAMIEKTENYNLSPLPGEWQNRVMLIGALLYPEPNRPWGYGDKICDSLATFVPTEFQLDTLYEDSLGNHPNNQLDVLNEGTAFMAYAAHGCSEYFSWYDHISWYVIFSTDSIPYMTNGEKLPWVIGHMCCTTGSILTDGLSELMVEHDAGGAIVAATSSSFAYGGHTEPGASVWLDIYFTYLLFQNDFVTAGVTHGLAKDVVWASWNSYYLPRVTEWVLQSSNLLGDPCTVFTAAPQGVESQSGACLNVTVSPNPIHHSMNVSVSIDESSPVQITLYDMLGRVVLQNHQQIQETGLQSLTLDVSSLSNGMYMVLVNSSTGAESVKCVVIR